MKAKLIDIVKETTTTNRFYLRPDSKPTFKPGQFVSLDLPIKLFTNSVIAFLS